MTKQNGNTIEWRVKELEGCNEETQEKLDKIMTNHLPHINEQLVAIRGEMSSLSTRISLGIGVNIVLLIAGVLGVVLIIK
jgi:hypothetical protein